MKKTLLCLCSVLYILSYSQETKKDLESTKSDKFSQRSGTLLQKDFIDLGKVSGTDVKVLKIADLNNNDSVSSVRFENKSYSSYSSDNYINAIDKDELDGLMISIKKLLNNVLKTNPLTYTEVIYNSRGGFSLGSYYETKKSKWTSFLKVEKHNSKSMDVLTENDLQNLLNQIGRAHV